MSLHRLLTRSDFDGLVCAVLLRTLDPVDEIVFVHPKDVQDGAVAVSERDILTTCPTPRAPTWSSTTICPRPAG